MKNPLLALLCLTALAGACASPAPLEDDVAASEDELSTSSFSYVTLRRDYRRCVAPLCGGFFAKDVNKRSAEVYVNGLDFSQSGLDAATQALVSGGNELLVRGRLGRMETRFRTRPLIVTEAYRGLPGARAAAGDTFYAVDDKRAVIRCIAAPCNGLTAKKLGTTGRTSFTGYELEPVLATLADRNWIDWNIGAKGWLVAGHFEQGERFPAGYAKILETSQVYVRLPALDAACPQFPLARCPEGFTMSFSRNADRCLIPNGCVEQRMCTLQVPQCDDGYTLDAWSGENGGCTAYACDPSFTVAGAE